MVMMIKKNSGFTLVELLIASVLSALVTFAAMDFYLTQHRQYLIQEQVSDMQQRGRAALEEISYDLRQAGYNTPDTAVAYSIYDNPNGPDSLKINHHNNTISYYIDQSDTTHPDLIKSVNNNPQVFAEDIEDLQITSMGSTLLQVQITARTSSVDDMTAKDYRRRNYSTRVQLRNL